MGKTIFTRKIFNLKMRKASHIYISYVDTPENAQFVQKSIKKCKDDVFNYICFKIVLFSVYKDQRNIKFIVMIFAYRTFGKLFIIFTSIHSK